MILSDHLELDEMVRSATADRLGIDNTPPSTAVASMCLWATTVFEPLRQQFGPIVVTSGFRCPELNAAVGGVAENDPHTMGCAGDIRPVDPQYSPKDLVAWLANSSLLFDQAILEAPGTGTAPWCHVGIARPGFGPPRREVLSWDGAKYVPWTPEDV